MKKESRNEQALTSGGQVSASLGSELVTIGTSANKSTTPTTVKRRPGMWFREAGACEGPGCNETVPAGVVYGHQTRWFCSNKCRRRAKNLHRRTYKQIVIGSCEHCNGPIIGTSVKRRKNPRYCSTEHFRAAQFERIMRATGPLAEKLLEYARLNPNYAESTAQGVKTNLARAARYFHGKLGIERWEDVRPDSIGEFIHAEKQRGIKSTNSVGQLSTYFRWLIGVKRIAMQNPVIHGLHKQKSRRNDPRPLEAGDIALSWKLLVDSGDVALMLAFAIGEECGLRGSETCNIREQDVDTVHRTILVRLPTKNGVERTIPYHDKVAHHLALWTKQRNSECGHDHLLHGPRNAPFTIHALDERLSRIFAGVPMTRGEFVYHRLRHTWASNLYNSGMDLAVLQKLGGWLCLATLQVYVQVRMEKIELQYQQAYERMKLRQQEPAEEIISMEQFLRMEERDGATYL